MEVIDTQSYDPYFTFLASKHAVGISGYVIMFDQSNPCDSVQLIYDKLFQINGINKPIVIVANVNTEMRLNDSNSESFLSNDDDIREFSLQNHIPYLRMDVKNAP